MSLRLVPLLASLRGVCTRSLFFLLLKVFLPLTDVRFYTDALKLKSYGKQIETRATTATKKFSTFRRFQMILTSQTVCCH